jgi:hypothetical protein
MSKLQSIVSRSRGKVAKKASEKEGAPFAHSVTEFGPFRVYFAAHHRKDKDANGKQVWVPTGELSMKIEIGDSWPKTSIGWNHEGSGPLGTIAENLDAFLEAVTAAVALWGDDDAFEAAKTALDAHIGQTSKPQATAAQGGLVDRVKNRAAS